MIKNFLAGIGIVGLVIGLVGCTALTLFTLAWVSDMQALNSVMATIVPENYEVRVVGNEPMVLPVATATPLIVEVLVTAVPLPTDTPHPTATAVQLVPSYNLPPMGPYSLQEIDLCEAIINDGNLDTLPLPQRGLCEQYVAMRNK